MERVGGWECTNVNAPFVLDAPFMAVGNPPAARALGKEYNVAVCLPTPQRLFVPP